MTAPAAVPARTPLPLTRGGMLDGLRFAAAFSMVVYHFSFISPVPLAKLHPLFGRGYLTTDFFLIVSGYVLGRIYGERVQAADVGTFDFFRRRAQRVVPAHLIMLALFAAMVVVSARLGFAAQHPEYLRWRDLPGQALLLQAFGVPVGEGWNSPTWSLSALLGCYLMFPTLWRLQARIGRAWVVVALAVGAMIAADLASSQLMGVRVYEFPSRFGIGRAVPLFLLGAALARFSADRWIAPRVAWVMLIGAGSAVLAIQPFGRFDFVSIALIAVMVTGAGAVPAPRPSHLLEKGAVISFAVFITNEFVRFLYAGALHAVTRSGPLNPGLQWASWWAALAAAVAFAVAFHYLVDMPTQGWLKRLARRPRPPPLVAEAPA